MRIIGGRLRGRIFDSPKGHRTHPMSEKMRGALFSALGDIQGLNFLDAFTGSGAMSFEAISRGAASAVAIDSDKSASRAAKHNAEMLGIARYVRVINSGAGAWQDNNPDALFDILICDPPYDKLNIDLLQKLARHSLPKGLFILSWPGTAEAPTFSGLEEIKRLNYGDSQLVFYRKDG